MVSDKRLRVEISALRQMVNNSKVVIQWVEGLFQISDPLTKRGASTKLLRAVLKGGKLQH